MARRKKKVRTAKRKGNRRTVRRTVTTRSLTTTTLTGFEEEVDQVFVAADDGDCRRAWDHFDRAEVEASKAVVAGSEKKLTMLQKQLLRACPAKTGRAVEEERLGIIEPGDFWVLAGIAVVVAGVVLSRRGTLTGYVQPGDPEDRFWHPWRYPPEVAGVFQGKVVS